MATVNFKDMRQHDRPITYSNLTAKATSKAKRACLKMCIRLSGKISFTGLPKSFAEQYESMQSSTGPGAPYRIDLDHELSNQHIEFFIGPDVARARVAVDAATIDKFYLEKDRGEPESVSSRKRGPGDIFLWFTVTFDLANDKDAKTFTWDYLGTEVWWTAEPLQGELLEPAGVKA